MSLWSKSKTQTDLTTQVGASEEAVLLYQGGNSKSNVAAGNLNQNSNLVDAGLFATNQSNLSNVDLVLGGVNLGSGTNTGTINIQGAAGAEAIAQKFTETLTAINDSASTDKLQAQELISDALGKLTQLSESKQTEGITSLGRLALWGLAIVLAGVIAWKWSK